MMRGNDSRIEDSVEVFHGLNETNPSVLLFLLDRGIARGVGRPWHVPACFLCMSSYVGSMDSQPVRREKICFLLY